jgi:hypothetical protein
LEVVVSLIQLFLQQSAGSFSTFGNTSCIVPLDGKYKFSNVSSRYRIDAERTLRKPLGNGGMVVD